MEIRLFDAQSGEPGGTVSEEDLAFLQEQLEEEFLEDQDYYINRATIHGFEASGASERLLRVLRSMLGAREDMDIRWMRAAE